jgi:anti-anti-sigma regulatory factor
MIRFTVAAEDGVLVARLAGTLNGNAVARVRSVLLKCLAEQPDALIVDVSDVFVQDHLALTVFAAVCRQAAMWPATPVLLCGPSERTATLLSRAAYRRIPVVADVDAARAEASQGGAGTPSLLDELLPIAGAARQARDLATEACLRWDQPHLVGPACIVVTEFVANAVTHAATAMTLRLALTERFLHVSVRDGSDIEPRLDSGAPAVATTGRGLRLVEAVASSWGSLPAEGGKVVWAVLALRQAST